MALLALDLGGTKLATALFSEEGGYLRGDTTLLQGRQGAAVGVLIGEQVTRYLQAQGTAGDPVRAIGACVPGLYRKGEGTVWAPNISGWDHYPLQKELEAIAGGIPVAIDSDRACCILGEAWQGAAKGCTDAVFLAVGTGIGAGILAEGRVLRGAYDTAGAAGWLAVEKPYRDQYETCGCLEWSASGEGIPRLTRELLDQQKEYSGTLRRHAPGTLSAYDVFEACAAGDALAGEVVRRSIESWGMAVANLVSLLNPQKIILGGGVFGPATRFLPDIIQEAHKWAQPLGMKQASVEPSLLGGRAGLYGAAYGAAQTLLSPNSSSHV